MKREKQSSSPNESQIADDILFIHQFINEKLWQNYIATDSSRKRTFYYLFYSMIVIGLFWITGTSKFELPLIKTEIDVFIALSSAPLVICLLTVRLIYLLRTFD